jgi:predicted O-methyltransferase YrrM
LPVHRPPFTIHRPPFTIHRPPFTVHRPPFTVHRSFCHHLRVNQETWTAVDEHFTSRLIAQDDSLSSALKASDDAGLPAINVTPSQGKLLNILARIHGAQRILEIGTLGGYSTIWMAQALPPNGRMVSLEFDPHHAEVATANLKLAGLSGKVEVRVGAALDSLPALENEPPFDIVFIDADKENNPHYFEWALKLTHPGSLIIIDNVVRGGAVVDAESEDPNILGVRKVLDMIGAEPRVTGTAIQTVGSKGYDGLAIVLVN